MIHFLTNMPRKFDSTCRSFGEKLDKHPTTYKIILVTLHIFRTAMLYTTPLLFFTVYLPLSLIYRVSIERFCCFKFSIPSLFGMTAFFLAERSPLGYIPLTVYVITICYISNRDIKNRIHSRCGR
jgi:hypothetical protein